MPRARRVTQIEVVEPGGELGQGLPDQPARPGWGAVPAAGQLPAQSEQPPRPGGRVVSCGRGRAQLPEGVGQAVQLLPAVVVDLDGLGADFVAGVVFFTGDRPLPFGDRLLALPVSLLWGGGDPPPSQ